MSYHHWFRPFYAVSQHHVSMSQLIQKRLQEIICELDDDAAWSPGRLHESLNRIRPLFDAEENLMIQSHYPDYPYQRNAHCCFMREMAIMKKSANFLESEHYAVTWLNSHESLSGTMFHNYLLSLSGEKKESDMILLVKVNPAYPVLPQKIIQEADWSMSVQSFCGTDISDAAQSRIPQR